MTYWSVELEKQQKGHPIAWLMKDFPMIFVIGLHPYREWKWNHECVDFSNTYSVMKVDVYYVLDCRFCTRSIQQWLPQKIFKTSKIQQGQQQTDEYPREKVHGHMEYRRLSKSIKIKYIAEC